MKKLNFKLHTTSWILIISVVLYVALFFTLTILRYKAFFSYEWEDLAAVNWVHWNISQGNSVGFLQFMFQNGKYYFMHIPPMMFLVSVIFAFAPHIYTLFFLVTFSLAVAAVPIYLIGKELLKNRNAALLLSMAYLFYSPKSALNFLDGDPSIFVIPLLLFTYYAVLIGKRSWFIICSILVMLCRTETPVYIIVLVLYLLARRRQFSKISTKTYLIIGGVSAALLALNISLSQLLSEDSICYACRESGVMSTIWFVLTHPTFNFLSDVQIQSLLKLFLPVLCFPIFTMEILLGLPSLFFLVVVDNFVYQRAHYITALIPALFIGSIYFIKKVQLRFKMKSSTALAAVVFLGCLLSNFTSNIIGGPFPIIEGVIKDSRFLDVKNIYDKKFYMMDNEDKIAWRMIDRIPKDPDVAVSASGDLLAPLSSRKKLIEFLDDSYDYYDVDYILIHNKHMYMGAGHYFWDDKRMEEELKKLMSDVNWEMIDQEETFYLFKNKHRPNIKALKE